VLCDRFLDASTAYQGAGRGLGIEHVQELNRLATRGRFPDLTLLLDLDPAAGRIRQHDRPDRMEQADLDFHRAVRDGYRRIADAEPERFAVLDAARPAAEVASRAWKVLTTRFPDRTGHVTDR
jgi:dTMP kinase